MTKFILPELEISPALNYPNFLESLNDDQLQIVEDLEKTYRQNQKSASFKARAVLKAYPWPKGYSTTQLDFATFDKDYAASVSGEVAFYYYIYDKCIPRWDRNPELNFMDRIYTFSKASKREHFEATHKWILKTPTGDIEAILAFDPASGSHDVLLPQPGERAPDFKLMFNYNGNTHVWGVEEKPCISVEGAIRKYSNNHKDLHGADKLMLALEADFGNYKAGYYLHNYKTGVTMQMIPVLNNIEENK
jgi:hypothetical protein